MTRVQKPPPKKIHMVSNTSYFVFLKAIQTTEWCEIFPRKLWDIFTRGLLLPSCYLFTFTSYKKKLKIRNKKVEGTNIFLQGMVSESSILVMWYDVVMIVKQGQTTTPNHRKMKNNATTQKGSCNSCIISLHSYSFSLYRYILIVSLENTITPTHTQTQR